MTLQEKVRFYMVPKYLNNCKLKKKVLPISLAVLIIGGSTWLTGCNTVNVENEDMQSQTVDEFTHREESTAKSIEMEDGTSKEILSLFESLAWRQYSADDYSSERIYKFTDLQTAMGSCADHNSFAEEFIEKADKTNYEFMDETSKKIFDTYVQLIFREELWLDGKDFSKYKRVTQDILGDISEVWIGSSDNTEDEYLFLRIEGCGFTTEEDRSNYVVLINRTQTATSWQGNMQDAPENRILKDWSGNALCEMQDFGANQVNENVITPNRDFFDWLTEYRDTIYSSLRYEEIIAEVDAEEAEENAEKKEKLEQELSVPEVGMTAEEVESTGWGKPDKINKDTYEWGTKEQWVYDGRGYVYLEDGIVTSVSER